MSNKKAGKLVLTLCVLGFAAFINQVVFAQNKASESKAPAPTVVPVVKEQVAPVAALSAEAAAPAKPIEMTEEQKAMQARMQEYSTINEHHAFLKSLEGKWGTHVKFWMDPKGPAEESDGISDAKVILDGHFLEQNFTGTAMGKPFEGRGILGYDNLRKQYVGIWLDNMATGIMTSSGQYDEASKVLKAEGSMSCPITNETNRWYREVTTITDADHYLYETYMKGADGNEFKAMEISYSRMK